MMRGVLHWFATGPDAPPIGDMARVRQLYGIKRWSVFLSILLGYSVFYVCRQSFAITKKAMLDEGILDVQQMGNIGTALLITYAVGKFVNGFLADRANVRRFMATGLMAVAVTVALFGANKYYSLFFLLWGLHGWFQSMGAVPSGVALSQWFSNRERGSWYSFWSASHSIGEGLSLFLTAGVVTWLGWRYGFWAAAALAGVAAMVMYKTLSDRPETCGLPNVADYRNDHASDQSSVPLTTAQAQREVFRNPYVWIVCLASLAMYITRYGMNSWGVLYLQETKEYSLMAAGGLLSLAKILETVGTVASGFISDIFFKSRRSVVTIASGIFMVGGLALFSVTPSTDLGDLPGNMRPHLHAEGAVDPALRAALAELGVSTDDATRFSVSGDEKSPGWVLRSNSWFSGWGGCRVVDTGDRLRVFKNYQIQHLVGASIYGMGIGCLISFLGGLIAIDICSKKASGAAMGVVGICSYIGATLQEQVSGRLIQAGMTVSETGATTHDFSAAMTFWMGSAVASLVLSCFLWNARARD
ncbi:MAG TPA: MFS transporter [Candidatus Hydrogenedentes bacterium]|nr:MFS transporter [Candidatus Hydrogenedentota bacterium]